MLSGPPWKCRPGRSATQRPTPSVEDDNGVADFLGQFGSFDQLSGATSCVNSSSGEGSVHFIKYTISPAIWGSQPDRVGRSHRRRRLLMEARAANLNLGTDRI